MSRLLSLVLLFFFGGYCCALAHAASASCDGELFPIVKGRKLGFIDSQGREVIPPKFDDYANVQYFPALPVFSEGLAPVSEKGRFGYIDCSGQFAITPQFAGAHPFSEGIAGVREMPTGALAGEVLWIDHAGRSVHKGLPRHLLTDLHDGRLLLGDETKGWQTGYVNREFQWAIAPRRVFRSAFHDGLALFGEGEVMDRKFGFINTDGNVVIPAKYDRAWDFNEGLAGVCYWRTESSSSETKHWQCGFIDPTGKEVIPPTFQTVSSFSQGCALVEAQDGRRMIIDGKGTTVLALDSFDIPGQFHEGLAVARHNKQMGFVDTQGNWAIPTRFAGATDFAHGLAMVQFSDSEYGYIDRSGKVIWQAKTSVPPMVFIPSTFAAGAR